MKEYDYVKLIVEKEKYAKEGVHKGMDGWICDSRIINNQRLVSFEKENGEEIACIPIKEADLEVIWEAPVMQVGLKVLLFTDTYASLGITKGLRGVVIAKADKDGHWLVRFEKQQGLTQETDIAIDEKYLAII